MAKKGNNINNYSLDEAVDAIARRWQRPIPVVVVKNNKPIKIQKISESKIKNESVDSSSSSNDNLEALAFDFYCNDL